MKKIIAVVLLLSVLSVAAFCMIGGTVSEEKANVTIKENIIYGDKSYADGVALVVYTIVWFDQSIGQLGHVITTGVIALMLVGTTIYTLTRKAEEVVENE